MKRDLITQLKNRPNCCASFLLAAAVVADPADTTHTLSEPPHHPVYSWERQPPDKSFIPSRPVPMTGGGTQIPPQNDPWEDMND